MQDALDMAGGLEALLADVVPDRQATVDSYRPLSGGYSRASGRADVRWSDGTVASYLLRADPVGTGGVFQSDRDDEWALLTALATVEEVKVAAPLWYDGSGKYFGTKCIVQEFCAAVPLQTQIEATGADLDAATKVFVDVAASIHHVPLDALPPTMPRPTDWDTYLDGVIDIFERTEREIAESSPVMRYVAAWLRSHRPPPVPLTLVHGDMQPGNVLVADGRPPIVIDWEFGRIGDPREDLGYYIQLPMPPNLLNRDPEAFLVRYRERSGLTKDQLDVNVVRYFLMIGMARLLAQLVNAVAALDAGHGGGAMTTYLINAITHQCDEYLKICRSNP